MNRHCITVLILLCAIYSCKKENQSTRPDADVTSEISATCDDGEAISKTYSPNQLNAFSAYSFGGVAGTYFGYRSTFDIGKRSKIDISFGTLLSANHALSESDILELISPGEKTFGSLGAYTSYPELVPDRVEIAYTDKRDFRWCSTLIREKKMAWGIETEVTLLQPGSTFIVDKVKPVAISSGVNGYRVQGHFSCVLYEVNGQRTKKIKGNFSGVISTGT